MRAIEAKIRRALEDKGIKCQSVYKMPDPEDVRVLLAFNSRDNRRISTTRVENILNTLGVGQFKVPKEFQRLSSAFLHLEVTLGARTEEDIQPTAM